VLPGKSQKAFHAALPGERGGRRSDIEERQKDRGEGRADREHGFNLKRQKAARWTSGQRAVRWNKVGRKGFEQKIRGTVISIKGRSSSDGITKSEHSAMIRDCQPLQADGVIVGDYGVIHM